MNCSKCGAELEKDSKFCSYCGNEIPSKKGKTKKEETVEEAKEEVKVEKVEVKEKVENTNKVTDGKATASLVLGICSFVVFCLMLPLSIIGLILGIASKEKSGKRTAGIVINAIGLALSLICSIVMLIFGTAISAAVEAYNAYDNKSDFFEILEKEIEKNSDVDLDLDLDEDEDEKTKVVGDDYYGYVKVPENWVEFKDLDSTGTFQYTDIGDTGYIITLNTYEENISPYQAAMNVKNHSEEEGNEASYKFGKINKYSCYIVNAKYTDGTYLDAYLFKADDGKLHYVSIEGPDDDNDNFDIPDTFSLNK